MERSRRVRLGANNLLAIVDAVGRGVRAAET
jgi:hypothetical protein